jgi:2-hydroxychromene-2-carboxylate isomerase
MGMVSFEFHFDFGSPNTYMSHRLIPGIEERTGVKCTYVPVLLGGIFKMTNNRSPMEQFGEIKNKPEYLQLEMQRFIAKHGFDKYKRNPHFPVITVQVIRGALVAQEEGYYEDYIEAVYVAMWENQLKMDDPEVIRATLDAAGLDGGHILQRITEQPIKDKLIANTQASVDRGAFGSPTFFVGDEMFFGKDRLVEVEEELARQAG